MKLGFIGLGKMGGQMVARLLNDHHEVVVTDLNASAVEMAIQLGAVAATDRAEMIVKLQNDSQPMVIWLMIPAALVDAEIDALLQQVSAGSIIIDGGNSDYRLTLQRAARCLQHQVQLIDVGTSGGVLGLKDGFSMMVGGELATVNSIDPIIKSLARLNGYRHFGPTGAGHFIKMVHNGIEYGLMQSYAEGYHVLKDNKDFPGLDLAAVAEVWQNGSIISSGLNEIVGKIMAANPELTGIDGFVAESGEAKWTLEIAKDLGIELPVVQAAMNVRLASQQGKTNFATKLLAAMRNVFGGHAINQ